MAGSCATISVSLCYILCSIRQGTVHAKSGLSHDKTPRPRLPHRTAGHGAPGFAGPALDAPHYLGAARGPRADLARAAQRLRRGLTDGAERAAEGVARSRLRRSRRGRRLRAHAARQGAIGTCAAAASLRGEVERTI